MDLAAQYEAAKYEAEKIRVAAGAPQLAQIDEIKQRNMQVFAALTNMPDPFAPRALTPWKDGEELVWKREYEKAEGHPYVPPPIARIGNPVLSPESLQAGKIANNPLYRRSSTV